MTAGSCFVMWLGEQITDRGIGQGASLIITAGIIAGIREPLTDTLRPTCLTRLTVVLESMSVVVAIAMSFCFAEDPFIEPVMWVSATARASVNRPSPGISRQPV